MSLISNLLPFVTDTILSQAPNDLWLACTAMLIRDNQNNPYAGRTMELTFELPYLVASIPAGHKFSSVADGHPPLEFTSKYNIFAIAIPNGTIEDLKIVEGMNEKGLTYSVLAYSSASGPTDTAAKNQEMLAAIDLGAWVLAQFTSTDEVKAALQQQEVLLTRLAPLKGVVTPFHFIVHDRNGSSIVIEFSNEKQNVYDNPVRVMTNGPEFPWHLTNMNNYSFLTNQDKSVGKIGDLELRQPDSGIATAGLPSSNTSVGRFVRAAYYANFAEKVSPDKAISVLAHVMNNFDRPRAISIDTKDSGGLQVEGIDTNDGYDYKTEYTSWTVLGDLNNNQFYVRTYDSINFIRFDLNKLFAQPALKIMPLPEIAKSQSLDVTELLLSQEMKSK